MNRIPDDTYISEINVPGTHDSCSRIVAFPYFSKCHDRTIKEQLMMGVRLFDLRLQLKNDTFRMVHAIVTCRKKLFGKAILFNDVLADCKAFLSENPDEFIVMSLKVDNGPCNASVFKKFADEYFKSEPELWYTGCNVPKLKEVRGKIVFFNRFYDNGVPDNLIGLNFCPWNQMSGDKEIEARRFGSGNGRYVVQDSYNLHPDKKWRDTSAMLDFTENGGCDPVISDGTVSPCVAVNYFSANDAFHSPRIYKRFMYRRIESRGFKKGKKYGWILLDYPTPELCKTIFETNIIKKI